MGATKEIRKVDKKVLVANEKQALRNCAHLVNHPYGIRNTWGIAMDVDIQQKIKMGLKLMPGKQADNFEEFLKMYWHKFIETKLK